MLRGACVLLLLGAALGDELTSSRSMADALNDADKLIGNVEKLLAAQGPHVAQKAKAPAVAPPAQPRFRAAKATIKAAKPVPAKAPQQAAPAAPAQQLPKVQNPRGFNFNQVSVPPYMSSFAQNPAAMRFAQNPAARNARFQQQPGSWGAPPQQQQQMMMQQQMMQGANPGMAPQMMPGMMQGANPAMAGQMQFRGQNPAFQRGGMPQQQFEQMRPGQRQNAMMGVPPAQRNVYGAPSASYTPRTPAPMARQMNQELTGSSKRDVVDDDGVPPPAFLTEISSKEMSAPERETFALESQYRSMGGVADHASVAGDGHALPASNPYESAYQSSGRSGRSATGSMPHGEADPGAADFMGGQRFKRMGSTVQSAPQQQMMMAPGLPPSMGESLPNMMPPQQQMQQGMQGNYQMGQLNEQQGRGPLNTPFSQDVSPAQMGGGKQDAQGGQMKSQVKKEEQLEIQKAMAWERENKNLFPSADLSAVKAPQQRFKEQKSRAPGGGMPQFLEQAVSTGAVSGNIESVNNLEAKLNAAPGALRGGAPRAGLAAAFAYGHASDDRSQPAPIADGDGGAPTYDNTHAAGPEQRAARRAPRRVARPSPQY